MYIYIIIFLMLSFLEFSKKKKNFFCYLILVIFIGIRYEVGFDFESYYNLGEKSEYIILDLFRKNIPLSFDSSPSFYQYYRFEILNKILYKIVWFFKGGGQLAIFFYSFLTIYLFKISIEFVKNKTVLPWLIFYSVPIYLFYYLSIMRQGIAILLCFFSYRFILKKELLKFLLTVLVAIGFHKSAVIFIPAFFLRNVNLRSILGLAILFFSFSFDKILKIIVEITGFYNHYLAEKYQITSGTKIIYLFLIVYTLINIKIYRNRKWYEKNKEKINIFFIGIYLFWGLKSFGLTGVRLANYYLVYFIYLAEISLNKLKPQKLIKLITHLILLFILLIALIVDVSKNERSQLIPYKIFFIEQK